MQHNAYARVLVHAPVGIFRIKQDRVILVNPALAQMLGYDSPDEMMSSPSILGRLLESLGLVGLRKRRANRAGSSTEHEIECHRRDGSFFPGHLRLLEVPDESGENGCFEGYLLPRQPSGAQAEDSNLAASPANKEKLTGIFAHDFNNILAAMLLRLELLRLDSDLSADVKEDLAELEAETSRAQFLTRYLMALSGRKRFSKPQALDLTRLINHALMRLRPLIGRNATLRFEPSPGEIWIFGETSSVEDLITILCLHPSQAALCDGELILKTSLVEFENDQILPIKELRHGHFVCLSLTETWKSTEPVEAASREGKRHELALLPLEEFARQNHGWVEAEHGGWNEFMIRVYLPTIKPAAGKSPDHASEVARACSETILVVEDELALRRLAALSLRKLGYAVLEAGDEKEALQIWQKHHAGIDLLFTDMVMPESMTGLELARKMRGRNKALRVIAASGYGIADEERANFDREDIAFLTKPYNAREVAKTVRDCLDRHPQGAD